MRISYELSPDVGITANLVREWKRGEIEGPVMSASSGPKDYTRNHIWFLFDRFPGVERVLMLRGEYTRSVPFLIAINAAGHAFDMAGEAVVIEP